MEMLTFTVIGQPITQGSKLGFVVAGRVVVKDMSNKKTKTQPAGRLDRWRKHVAKKAKKAFGNQVLWDGPIRLDLEFVLPRPESHYTKVGKRLTKSAPMDHVTKPDRGKLARAVEDALSGVVYVDDSQITCGASTKRYAAHVKYPGVVVRVGRVV